MFCNRADHPVLDRRTFLIASAVGVGGLGRTTLLLSAAKPTTNRRIAKSTILIWLDGGASHIDTWDMKPAAPAQIRGEFAPIATSTSGITLCEHLPLLSRQTHHLAIVHVFIARQSAVDGLP